MKQQQNTQKNIQCHRIIGVIDLCENNNQNNNNRGYNSIFIHSRNYIKMGHILQDNRLRNFNKCTIRTQTKYGLF